MINLGYACINTKLSGLPKSKRITTNRSMIKRTFQQKGIKYASELALANVRDLKKILSDWDEGCDGCLEKGDFIKRIEELKPKYMREEL